MIALIVFAALIAAVGLVKLMQALEAYETQEAQRRKDERDALKEPVAQSRAERKARVRFHESEEQ